MKRLSVLTVVPAMLLIVTACGGSDSESTGALPDVSAPAVSEPSEPSEPLTSQPAADELAGDTVVFVWTETGGCFQGGPNCARYEVSVDGTVETFREGETATDGAEATSSVDPALVQAWRDSLVDEDIDALGDRVGEGEMTAAFDGVDFIVANPAAGVELSSVEMAFDESEPVFAAAVALAAAARDAAPLEVRMR